MRHSIKRIYTRHYRDNDQLTAYVEWNDGARTEGEAEIYHGIRVPCGEHMGALFDRGWTIQNPDGTIGCGRAPCATREEAQALADRLNAIGFRGMQQD